MIVIGSQALALLGHTPPRPVRDIDMIGVEADIPRIRSALGKSIVSERTEFDFRRIFELEPGMPVERIEFDFEQAPSDRMLPGLCDRTATIHRLEVALPPVEVLYLTKRAHANTPIRFLKAMDDLLALKPLAGGFTPAQEAYYRARRQECRDRYDRHRLRVSPSIGEEDLAVIPGLVHHDHADLHRAVAHAPDRPLLRACRHGARPSAIDPAGFAALSIEDRLRTVREEFMVIAIERFHTRVAGLDAAESYRRGMAKTIRDRLAEPVQDFCLDHLAQLQEPPFDFVARFEAALACGEIRPAAWPAAPPGEDHKTIWELIQRGDFAPARQRAEDLARAADHGADRHALFLLGVVLDRTGRHDRALAYLTKAIEHDRKNAIAWFHVGTSSQALGHTDRAIKALERAVALGLRTPAAYWHLGLAREAGGQAGAALAAFREARARDPAIPGLASKLAALEKAAGDG